MNSILQNFSRLDEMTKSALKNSLTSMFQALVGVIHQVMDDLDESKEEYHIKIHPLTIERIDGAPVPEHLLKGIQSKLQLDQGL